MSVEFKMAWRNIWRNTRRTILTLCAIALSAALLVFMLSFQAGSYDTMINASVRIHTGHLQVLAKKFHEDQDIRYVVPRPEAVTRVLDRMDQVAAYTRRAEGFALVSSKDRTYGAWVVGIDPEKEAKVSTLPSLVRTGRYLEAGDGAQALVGALLARNLKVSIGDDLTLLGQGRDGGVAASVVKVKGIYKSGIDAFDRSSIQIPLAFFQNVFDMGHSVHMVVVLAKSLSQVDLLKKQVSKEVAGLSPKDPLVVMTWDELTPGLKQGIHLDLIFGFVFYAILVIVVAFSIMNTFLMAVFERTREFGVLMALGTAPNRLVRLLLTESMIMTAFGIVCGMVLGTCVTLFFQFHGIDVSGASDLLSQYGISGRMYPKLTPLTLTVGPFLVLVVTFVAALYPAFKIRGLSPIKALMSV